MAITRGRGSSMASMTGSSLALATVAHRRSPSELVQGDAIVDPDGWVLTTDELIQGANSGWGDEASMLAKQVRARWPPFWGGLLPSLGAA